MQFFCIVVESLIMAKVKIKSLLSIADNISSACGSGLEFNWQTVEGGWKSSVSVFISE